MSLFYTQASAGSGKTFRIQCDVAEKLENEQLSPHEIIAVTFTRDAAEELKGRISKALLERGKIQLASGVMTARIGTVHSVFGQILSDFAFELGLSPEQRVLDDLDKQQVLAEALDNSLSLTEIKTLNDLSSRLSVKDWRDDILKIIELMRSNAMTSDKTDYIANESINSLKKHLPVEDSNVLESGFLHELSQAVEQAKQLVNPTKGLLKTIEDCEKILRQPAITWQNWIKVSKLTPTKMGDPFFAQAKTIGLNVLKCPRFQKEITDFISLILQATQKAMDTFAEIKRNRGLIDFVDQENLALVALDNPFVQKRLREEIRYLIIDEFQDTSPLQLAIFSKMSELVDDVLMVGDAKQAIYGFRGSDPKLTLDVLNYVQQGGGKTSTLSESWRSRSGLVELTNELFTAPFSHQLKAEQVQLTAKCAYKLTSPELGWWTLMYVGTKNNEKILSALAEGIREHISSDVEVWDKDQNQSRQATWRDLAVLCRSNNEAAELASYCARIGIPVSLERAGLVETPEVSLALACLRRLIDPADSLASAEILTLSTGNGPEFWLQGRLAAIDKGQSNEWNETSHSALGKLADARQNIGVLSTQESLDLAMLAADVTGTVCRWNEEAKLTEHRLANLARLVQLVDEYESYCQAQFLASTPTGFILWLKDQEQRFSDKQAANPGDAITIATYHKSKGLEWPIVICSSLDASIKISLFGPRITDQCVPFDWHTPLKGRSLCYWPNPFPDQKGNEILTELLTQTSEWSKAKQQACNEAVQLLYVGITRARDQLILSTSDNNYVGEWLRLINHSVLPPKQEIIKLTSGAELNVDMKSWIKPETPTATHSVRTRHWLTQQLHLTDMAPLTYYQPASKEAPIEQYTCTVEHNFGSRIALNGKPDMDRLGSVLHHCLALILSKPDIEVDVINGLVKSQIPGMVQGDQILSQGLALVDWLNTTHPNATLHTEMPITKVLSNGCLRHGSIDLVIETDKGWIIIDHKSNPQPESKWVEIAQKYSGQLQAYREVLEKLSNKPVLKTLIHFSVSGGLVDIKKIIN